MFNLKATKLSRNLKHIFGPSTGTVWIIEYQKRGLPHKHILLFLPRIYYFSDPDRVNKVVSAEFLDPAINIDGSLKALVAKHIIHGPCGDLNPKSLYIERDAQGKLRCKKRFPKTFQNRTVIPENKYPLYRRRNNGAYYLKRVDNREIRVSQEWIVAHNPFFLKKFNAYINIKICSGILAIKYIYKYIYKGEDRASMAIKLQKDEIARHLAGRFIRAN